MRDRAERNQSQEALPRPSDQLALLSEAAKKLLVTDNPLTFLEHLYDRVAALLDLEIYLHFTVASDGTHIELAACRGLTQDQRHELRRLEMGQAVCGTVAQSCLPMIVEDVQGSVDPLTEAVRSLGITAYVCHPLIANGELLGTLSFGTKTRLHFTDESVVLARGIADLVALAIARHRSEQELRKGEARFRGFFHNAAVGMAKVDTATGRLVRVNAALSRITGFREDELLDRTIHDLAHHDESEESRLHLQIAIREKNQSFRVEKQLVCKDGGVIWVRVNIGIIHDGSHGRGLAAVIIEDITERKHAEEHLEAKIEERTQALVASQHALRKMVSEVTLTELRERRRIATELHDYLAQLLVVGRLKVGQLSPAIEARPAKAVLTELDEILDRSLTYTRTLVAELSPTVLYELGLSAALQWLGKQMARNGLRVEVSVPQESSRLSLPEDYAVLIYQAVRELLLNVIKHAEVGTASLDLHKREEDELRVVVADAGKGFDISATGMSQRLSEKFGLLSISERLKGLGGQLQIESAPGKGTTATIIVPIPHENRGHGLGPKISRPDLRDGRTGKGKPKKQIRVALVDDHAMVRQGLRSALAEAEDLEIVAEAEDGYEAVEMARSARPDVVVMDINLPKLNGIEATRRILCEHPSITVIGISVYDDEQVAHAVREAGAKVFLPKGSAASNLISEIYAAQK